MAIGDSKTVQPGRWPDYLPKYVPLVESPSRIAQAGWSSGNVAAIIDAYLAVRNDTPRFVLINLGVNDMAAIAAGMQNQWKVSYAYILDALHAKWPNAKVYCARVWMASTYGDTAYFTELDDVLLPAVLASRSSWASVGIDERLILDGGDDGATYTTDGVHPNAAGYNLEALSWKTVLGF